MAEVLQEQLGIPFVDLSRIKIDPKLTEFVPFMLAKRHSIIPIKLEDGKLYIAMEDQGWTLLQLRMSGGYPGWRVVPVISFGEAIRNTVNQLYSIDYAEKAVQDYSREIDRDQISPEIKESPIGETSNAPVVRLVNSIIEQAVNMQASDIHIEPMEQETVVRFRIDGMLQKILNIPQYMHPAVVTRIKIMGNMDIAERRLPQDGRVDMRIAERNIDMRISTIPTIHGEKVALRILDQSNFLLPREKLGFTEENLAKA